LLAKSEMNGSNMHPLVALGKATFPGETGWNFADKYIFNAEGVVVARTKGVPDTMAAFEPLIEDEGDGIFDAATKSAASLDISIQWCGG